MRYLDGQEPDPLYPHSEGMHAMLSLTMGLSVFIAIVLLWLGIKGRVMWLTWWSGGLLLCSLAYLIADFFNWI